jgi:flagellar hook-basal body complex protein FliE
MDITSIQSPLLGTLKLAETTATQHDTTFADVLQSAVEAVNTAQQKADTAARDTAIGNATSLHETMIALEKADISLRLATQVRNRVVEAYQDVMRMQI